MKIGIPIHFEEYLFKKSYEVFSYPFRRMLFLVDTTLKKLVFYFCKILLTNFYIVFYLHGKTNKYPNEILQLLVQIAFKTKNDLSIIVMIYTGIFFVQKHILPCVRRLFFVITIFSTIPLVSRDTALNE